MPRRKRPVLGIDYIIDSDGRAQFTREYLLKLGTCCGHQCRYCPYVNKHSADSATQSQASAAVGRLVHLQPVNER